MNKRKIVTLLVAGTLTVGVVGGTLAYFSSQDSIVNNFATKGGNITDNEHGIQIYEYLEKPGKILPGDEVGKLVQVKNTADYEQFIKVKITPRWVEPNTWWNSEYGNSPDISMLKLNFNNYKDELDDSVTDGYWLSHGQDNDGGYVFYYIGKVEPSSESSLTKSLLRSVTLVSNAGNGYKNAKFDVKVDANGYQVKNGAYKEAMSGLPEELLSKYESLESEEVSAIGIKEEKYKESDDNTITTETTVMEGEKKVDEHVRNSYN